jgi:hypothetical protein
LSCFICGELAFTRSDALHGGAVLARFTAMGAAERMFFHFGGNICQDIVFDILGVQRAFLSHRRVPFLVTDSALSVSSDDLICPVENIVGTDYKAFACEALDRLGAILRQALDSDEISHATVVISEGWSPTFTELSCTPERLGETCIAHFGEPGLGFVDPLKILVRQDRRSADSAA